MTARSTFPTLLRAFLGVVTDSLSDGTQESLLLGKLRTTFLNQTQLGQPTERKGMASHLFIVELIVIGSSVLLDFAAVSCRMG